MENYSVKIAETTHELTAREKILMKDTTNAHKIDDAVDECKELGTSLIITPVDYVVLNVHNEKSKDRKDYNNYLIIADDGTKYVTGSPSFWSSFKEIWDEMKEESDESFQIEIYKVPSKNYNGKDFITCSII